MPGTRNLKVIKLTEAGRQFAADNVQWIFEADERAMEKPTCGSCGLSYPCLTST